MALSRSNNIPFRFTKLDVKDGFWQMAVANDDAWNFCYVLPHTDPSTTLDDTEIVVPMAYKLAAANHHLFSAQHLKRQEMSSRPSSRK